MTKSVRQTIIENAALEMSEQKRLSYKERKKGISEKTAENPFFIKKVVSLSELPVSIENFKNFDPSVRTTGGYYTLIYYPTTSVRYVKDKPYCIGQDLIRLSVRVSGPKHWHCLASRIPELKWLEKWSTLEDEMFAIAKKHPGSQIFFTIKWIEYCRMIESKAEEMGIDIDHKPLVVYAAKESLTEEINKTHLMAPLKTKQDYQTVLEETDKEMNVYGRKPDDD